MAAPALAWQPTLLGVDEPAFDPDFTGMRRRFLGAGAWVDHLPGWVTGADALFDQVLRDAPWRPEADRRMYDRIVAVPRLVAGHFPDRPPVLTRMGRALGDHYGRRLSSVWANLYRDGDDSVAWHGDRIGRIRTDTVVAIISLGATRRFLLRPEGGGPSVGYDLHGGDLLVMGGTCQRTWQHSIPKRSHAGPRVSVMFREPGGN
ncbi:MAG: alpha-ketoglutarate-dependent dioxygenase AlkB [Actinomycetota bacterium]|nr:alpha-ketoglutarate-dependent dioxygenase AlkB [Actinomycetota bacterium]